MRIQLNTNNIVSAIASVSLVVVLMAPSLKIRLEASDLYVYFIPIAVFAFCNLLLNLLEINSIPQRFKSALLVLLIFGGPFVAYFVGQGTDIALLTTVFVNVGICAAVIFFPWNVRTLNTFIWIMAIIGSLLAAQTYLFFGSDEEISHLVDHEGKSYLNVSYLQTSFAMGLGVICATYLVVKSVNPFSLLVFATGWMGLAVGRGRGALIFSVIVCIVYLLVALNTKVSSISRTKKMIIFLLIVSFVPVIVAQTAKVARNSNGIQQILLNTDVELVEGGRGYIWQHSFSKFQESPLFGNGLGQYVDEQYTSPHNLFLQWGVDSGIVGVLLLTLFWLAVIRGVAVGFKNASSDSVNLVLVCAALSVYVLLNYLKSGDGYVGRDLFILSALPIVASLAIQKTNKRRRRQRTNRQSRTNPNRGSRVETFF